MSRKGRNAPQHKQQQTEGEMKYIPAKVLAQAIRSVRGFTPSSAKPGFNFRVKFRSIYTRKSVRSSCPSNEWSGSYAIQKTKHVANIGEGKAHTNSRQITACMLRTKELVAGGEDGGGVKGRGRGGLLSRQRLRYNRTWKKKKSTAKEINGKHLDNGEAENVSSEFESSVNDK